MIAVLAAGLLTVLTGAAVSQIALAEKDKDKCEQNENDNCNKETQKIDQENNCKVVNENENKDKSDKNSNSGITTGEIKCVNFGQNPQNADAVVDIDPFE